MITFEHFGTAENRLSRFTFTHSAYVNQNDSFGFTFVVTLSQNVFWLKSESCLKLPFHKRLLEFDSKITHAVLKCPTLQHLFTLKVAERIVVLVSVFHFLNLNHNEFCGLLPELAG